MQNALIIAVAVVAALAASGVGAHAETLRVAGTGSALETLQRLGAAFTRIEPDTRLEVIGGLGSSGGIKAVASGAIDFSVSGRPLGPSDEQTLKAFVVARTPMGLASSHAAPGNIRSVDVKDLFGSATVVWPDGSSVRPILRPRSDSDSVVLGRLFPDITAVLEQLRLLPEIPVAATDQDNARLAEALPGSLTMISLVQMQTEKLKLRFLTIDGVAPTLEDFESGKYPYGKDIYVVFPSRASPARDRFFAFIASPAGREVLRASGSLPVGP
jgi:phosphate transport system substrate-binding protein